MGVQNDPGFDKMAWCRLSFKKKNSMTITAFVQELAEGRFRAAASQPIVVSAEGSSREEAMTRLTALAQEQLSQGEIVQIDLPAVATVNPWMRFAGIWKDHPEFDEYRANIAEYRRSVDQARSRGA